MPRCPSHFLGAVDAQLVTIEARNKVASNHPIRDLFFESIISLQFKMLMQVKRKGTELYFGKATEMAVFDE